MNSRADTGECQPPRNKVAASPVMANIPMYSAMKKVAYLKPEYSVMWPATISDSPSGTSNGVRFDSTRPDTKNKMNAVAPHGVKTNQRGTKPNVYPACAATILSGVSEPTTITTGSTVIMSGSSYLIICAMARIAPSLENLLLLPHPAIKTA